MGLSAPCSPLVLGPPWHSRPQKGRDPASCPEAFLSVAAVLLLGPSLHLTSRAALRWAKRHWARHSARPLDTEVGPLCGVTTASLGEP